MSAVPSSPRRGSRTASESSASESSASESSVPRCDPAALIDARLDDSDASRPRRESVSRAAQPRRANGQTPEATGGVGCAVAGEAQPVDGGAGLVRVQAEPERRQALLHGPGKRLQQMPAELQRRRRRREESGRTPTARKAPAGRGAEAPDRLKPQGRGPGGPAWAGSWKAWQCCTKSAPRLIDSACSTCRAKPPPRHAPACAAPSGARPGQPRLIDGARSI